MLQLTTYLFEQENNVYYHGLHVPATVAEELLADAKDRRVICNIEGLYEWHAALMPNGDGDFFINVSKEARKKTGLEPNQKNIKITLQKDESEYGMPVPEEVIELWAIDQEAQDIFGQLTPGKQRSLLYQIGKPKSSEIRAKKAVQILDYLKSTGGKLDFKELNAYIKEQNQY